MNLEDWKLKNTGFLRKIKAHDCCIDDITFELLAMHCGIGMEVKQKKIPQKKMNTSKI